jgi:hypothetical protein
MLRRPTAIAGLLLAVASCHGPDLQTSRAPARSAVVDSALSPEEALRRFRQELPEATSLSGGATSREGLVRAFLQALETRDSSALRAMTLSQAEFAWLYYPTAREANPPYALSPALLWFTQQGRSERGIRVALGELGGRLLRYLGHACAPEPRIEGVNRLWGFCTVRYASEGGDTLQQQLFGLVIERGGIFKFVSYANQLD